MKRCASLRPLLPAAWLGSVFALTARQMRSPLPLMSSADVSRFVGPWYVIAKPVPAQGRCAMER